MSAHDYPTKAANRPYERFIPNPNLNLTRVAFASRQFLVRMNG